MVLQLRPHQLFIARELVFFQALLLHTAHCCSCTNSIHSAIAEPFALYELTLNARSQEEYIMKR